MWPRLKLWWLRLFVWLLRIEDFCMVCGEAFPMHERGAGFVYRTVVTTTAERHVCLVRACPECYHAEFGPAINKIQTRYHNYPTAWFRTLGPPTESDN